MEKNGKKCFFSKAEDRVNVMNKERRIEGLQKVQTMITEDIQKEVKSREGILHLAQVYRETPNFSTDDGQLEVSEKLQQCESMLRFLQAMNHKVLVALADIEGSEKPRHLLQRFMERDRDKNSLPMTILRIPEWVARDLRPDDSGNIVSTAPPGSPPSNLERMSSRSSSTSAPSSIGRKEGARHSMLVQGNLYPSMKQGSFDTVDHATVAEMPPPYSEVCKGRCRAVYEYQARMPDELTIYPGETNRSFFFNSIRLTWIRREFLKYARPRTFQEVFSLTFQKASSQSNNQCLEPAVKFVAVERQINTFASAKVRRLSNYGPGGSFFRPGSKK
jgi:hypothetical protein